MSSIFPTELWEDIFALACTDDGSTGCALSLVSHGVHAISAPVRFQSVAVQSPAQLQAFLGFLERARSIPPIAHLFISHGPALGRRIVRRGARKPPVPDEISRLLAIVAPTLRTLFVLSDREIVPRLKLSFPRLTAVAMPFLARGGGKALPRLRRLSVVNERCKTWTTNVANVLELVPKGTLTHLRISGVHGDMELPSFMRIFLDLPVDSRGKAPFEGVAYVEGSIPQRDAIDLSARLPALNHVCFMPTKPPWHPPRSTELDRGPDVNVVHQKMLPVLQDLAKRSAEEGSRRNFILLPHKDRYTYDDILRDYLDYVEGGCGPWPETPQDYEEYLRRIYKRTVQGG